MQRAPHPASSVVGHREREQRVARSLLSHSGQRSVLSTEKRTAGLAAALPKVAGARRTRRPRGGVRGGGEEGGMEAGRLGGRENGGGGSRHRRRAAAATRCHCAACGVGAAGGPPPCRVHVCSTRRRRRRADVVEVPSPLSTSTSMNSGRQQRSMASSSTYWRAIAIALMAWLTLPAPMAVRSTRDPSRVQFAMAPASDFASVEFPTLRVRPSLTSVVVRRARLERRRLTPDSSSSPPSEILMNSG
mmetsp:Transcript_31633/g.101150  ORF Transcript_31633/g.101150 Transcript_31633/m.101150 type:complete len:246 (+) Transcript_31633:109-846(+)